MRRAFSTVPARIHAGSWGKKGIGETPECF